MQLIAGRTGQEYNRRKQRRGAFWEDGYHATAVDREDYLARCMVYIDLNTVRTGAVSHPRQWEVSDFREINSHPNGTGSSTWWHCSDCRLLMVLIACNKRWPDGQTMQCTVAS